MPRAVYDDLRAHGEAAYPHESCGVLLGCPSKEGWRIEALKRATNAQIDAAGSRYEIAPAELVGIVREAREQGLEIAGFYHSHPDHAARPSATDLAEAHWVGCAHVITEVAQGRAAETCAFLLAGATEEDKRFEAMAIKIEDQAAG
jgi:proteasome lid subunit RPN8/RPN11